MASTIAEPMRHEHRHLWPHIEELRSCAMLLDDWHEDVPDRMRAAVAYLREHLLRHMRAEETVLYPAYEAILDADGALSTMVADHIEIERRLAALDALTMIVTITRPPNEIVVELRDGLIGLDAILGLHFVKEEQIVIPLLDRKLERGEARALLDRMRNESGLSD